MYYTYMYMYMQRHLTCTQALVVTYSCLDLIVDYRS